MFVVRYFVEINQFILSLYYKPYNNIYFNDNMLRLKNIRVHIMVNIFSVFSLSLWILSFLLYVGLLIQLYMLNMTVYLNYNKECFFVCFTAVQYCYSVVFNHKRKKDGVHYDFFSLNDI